MNPVFYDIGWEVGGKVVWKYRVNTVTEKNRIVIALLRRPLTIHVRTV